MSLKERRQKTTKDVSSYNRFLWQRYSLAFLFFFNLNWMIFTLGSSSFFIVLLVLLVLCVLGLFEHVKLYGTHNKQLTKTKVVFTAQLGIAILMLISLLSEWLYKMMFPFLKYQQNALILVSIISLAIVVMCLLNLNTMNKIAQNKDSYYKKVVTVMNKY